MPQRTEPIDDASADFIVQQSPFGRIVVAPHVPEGFAVFYTTRDFDGRLNDAVARELTAFIRERFGIDASLTTCVQVHGVAARAATPLKQWRECDSCDALWSAERGVALGIKVADCLPVAMVDPVHNITANVHSGWRGAAANIVGETLDAIASELLCGAGNPAGEGRRAGRITGATQKHEASAWLGPSIRVCCFEVGEEVAQRFDERFVDRSYPKPHVDLVAYTTDILRGRGFSADRIHDSKLCTRCDGSIFHSYRRDGSGGRNLTFVA